MLITSAIGLGSSSDITMLSTDPEVIRAYTSQFQEHLAMCRSAMSVYSKFDDFSRLFLDASKRQGNLINISTLLSINTIPYGLYKQLINETVNPDWKSLFQLNIEQLPHFEKMLESRKDRI